MPKLFFLCEAKNLRIVDYLKTFSTKQVGQEQDRPCTLFSHRSLVLLQPTLFVIAMKLNLTSILKICGLLLCLILCFNGFAQRADIKPVLEKAKDFINNNEADSGLFYSEKP